MAFSQIIYEATVPQAGTGKPILTVAEAAKAMSVSESTIYDYRHDRTEPSYTKIKCLNRVLIKRGFYHLAFQFMPNEGQGVANGCLDDDAARMVQLIGRLYESYQSGNRVSYLNTIAEMEQVVRDFKAEGEKL